MSKLLYPKSDSSEYECLFGGFPQIRHPHMTVSEVPCLSEARVTTATYCNPTLEKESNLHKLVTGFALDLGCVHLADVLV